MWPLAGASAATSGGDANAAPTWVLLTERGIVDGGLLLEARQMGGELVPQAP